MYCYPHPLRRRGIVPGAARLTALLLECISLASLAFRRRGGETSASYATSYLILGYLVLLDAAELASLCGQASGRGCLPALPALAAGDALGLLVLACSRDWYGLWYWRGPWYSLSGEIGMGLFVALPTLRAVLVVLVVVEYWYETREDRVLAAERTALLPR